MAQETQTETPTETSSGGESTASFDASFDKAFEQHAGEPTEDGGDEAGDTDESAETTGSDDATAEDTDTGAGQSKETPQTKDEFPEETDPVVKALYAKLDPKIRKDMNRVFTKRSQSIAAQTKFFEAFQADPIAAARKVLQHVGAEDGTTAETTQEAEEVQTSAVQALSEGLAKAGFTPEQSSILTPLLSGLIEQSIKPLREQQDSITLRQVADGVDSEIQSFKKDYPDYDELEPAMDKLMDVVRPTPGVSTRQYLTILRTIALGDKGVDSRVKKTLNKMTTTAASASTRVRPVASSTVKPGPPNRLPTFEESSEAAMRNEVWGKGVHR